VKPNNRWAGSCDYVAGIAVGSAGGLTLWIFDHPRLSMNVLIANNIIENVTRSLALVLCRKPLLI